MTRGDFGLLSRDAMAITLRTSMLRRMQRGFFRGSARATFASRKIRASAAVEGTGVIPKSRIFSWTLIGP